MFWTLSFFYKFRVIDHCTPMLSFTLFSCIGSIYGNHIYMGRFGCVCMCVCVIRMDGQTACLMLTKISAWIAIYLGGNIGGLKFTPHLSKWSPPREVVWLTWKINQTRPLVGHYYRILVAQPSE